MEEARIAADGILKTLDKDTGEIPESRLKDGSSLRELWEQFNHADEVGGFNRSLVRQLINGHPPFDQSERDEEGTGDLFNVNTGNGRLIIDEATSGVMDIFSSERNLVEIPLDENIPDDIRVPAQRLIEDEFSKMLHEWDCFAPRVNNLCHTFVTDGIAALFFDNDETWHFNSFGLQDVKFPRDCEPVSSRVPVAIMRKSMHVGELYRKIADEKSAKAKGWNIQAVRDAIWSASRKRRSDAWRNWEDLEQDLKKNELYVSNVSDPVRVLWGFVEEFGGEISMVMGTADGEGEDHGSVVNDFLYKRPKRYKSANEVYQIFPYSTGHGNQLYSVRGLGHFIYQPCNAENVLYNRMMDAARFASTQIFRPRTNEDLEDLTFEDYGYGMIAPPGLEVIEGTRPMDLTKTLGPAIDMVKQKLNQVSGLLDEGPQAMGERANEATVGFALEQINKMNSFAITLAYPPLDRSYREMTKRVFIEDRDDEISKAMKKRLEKLGVTREIWRRVDLNRTRARRILRGATKTGRLLLLRQIRGMLIGEMDDEGRKLSARDIASEALGKESADNYFGQPGQTRTSLHEWIAELEVSQMLDGHRFEAKDGQDHLIHLRVKIEALMATKQGVEEGTLELEEYTLRNLPIWENANEHMGMLVVDPSMEEEAGALRQALQRLGELFANGLKAIQANQRQNAEQNGSGEQEMSPVEAQLLEERRKDRQAEADIARKDRESAAKIAREAREHDVALASKVRSQRE